MRARYAASADRNEFGSRSAASGGAGVVLPTPCTSVYSGAMWGCAATVIAASGHSRRTSAIAGSAMTASPSQFGATIRRLFNSPWSFVLGPGSIFHAPAPMHPEPEIGTPADVHLEHVGAA